MPNRYKKINFEDFSGGEGFKFGDKENSFEKSSLISVDKLLQKYLRAGYKFHDLEFASGLTFIDYFPAIGGSGNNGLEYLFDNEFRIPVVVSIAGPAKSLRLYRVYFSTDAKTIRTSLTDTLTDTYDGDLEFYQVGSKLYMTYLDTVTGSETLVSSNGGSSWTTAASAADGGFSIYHNGSYYSLANGVIRSDDEGASWTTIISPTSEPLSLSHLIFYKGFFYAISDPGDGSNRLIRFQEDFSSFEVVDIILGLVGSVSILNETVFISSVHEGSIQIFSYDGSNVSLMKEFENYELTRGVLPLYGCDIKAFDINSFYLMPYNENLECYELIKYNKNGFFLSNIAESGNVFLDLKKLGGDLVVLSSQNYVDPNSTPDLILRHNNRKVYTSLSSLDTAIQNIGENIPVYLKLTHDPLQVGLSVKVYVKEDQSSSWGSAVMTSNIEDAVSLITDIKNLFKNNFVQFRIELLNSYDLYSDLVGFWRLDVGEGVIARDSSKYANDGTLHNNATWVDGKVGKAVHFDGVSADVQIPDSAAIQNIFATGGTVCFWCNLQSDGEANASRLLDKEQPGTDGWFINVDRDNALAVGLVFRQDFSGDDLVMQSNDRVLTLNQDNFVIITYDASDTANRATVIVNGVNVVMNTLTAPTGTAESDVGNDLYIGNSNADSKTLDGWVDEVRLFIRELSTDEKTILYDHSDGVIDTLENIRLKYLYLNSGIEFAK